MKIENYIFDWSGTLSDDRKPVFKANSRMFSEFGLPRLTFKKWLSINTGTVFDYLHQNGIEEKPEKIYSVFCKHYQKVNKEGLLPIVHPKAQKILENFKKLHKKILVISAHPEKKLLAEIKEFKLIKYFDVIIGSVTNKSATIKKEMKKFNFEPEKTIYIGDTVYDIRSAKIAGVISGAVGYGYHSSKILLKEKPDFFFPDLKAILSLNNYRQKISQY